MFPMEGRWLNRYFTQYFNVALKGRAGHDQYVRKHSNQLCVVGLATTHSVMNQNDVTVTNVSFNKENKGKEGSQVRSINMSGKKKKGAPRMQSNTFLCHLTCSDGTEYGVWGAVPGLLLEVNERLLSEPDLIRTHADTIGFIAIIDPKRSRPSTDAIMLDDAGRSLLDLAEKAKWDALTDSERDTEIARRSQPKAKPAVAPKEKASA